MKNLKHHKKEKERSMLTNNYELHFNIMKKKNQELAEGKKIKETSQ